MLTIRRTNLLRVLICAFALVIGLAAGQKALAQQSSNTQSLANFREDYPLKEIRTKTFKDETVQLDGNAFIDCTFDNVAFGFDGDAPFRITDSHFQGKFTLVSNNPVVKATLGLVGAFMKLENASHNQPMENK